MTISSRTPEGTPNVCPLCGAAVCIEPSLLFGDAPCPNCGHLLWFFRGQAETHLLEHDAAESVRRRILDRLAERFGLPSQQVPNEVDCFLDLAGGSLALVELVIELEEEFGP